MTLYIKTDGSDGFVDHPIYGEHLALVFPEHDFSQGAPEGYVEFFKKENPYSNLPATEVVYKKITCEYKYIDGKATEEYTHVDMTDEEKKAKQDESKAEWAANNGYPSWVMDETNCVFEPPTPRPDDGKIYNWDESTTSWVEGPIS
jgi:hypothetical protein